MKKELLAATASAALLIYGAPAFADCLPNAGGTTVTCTTADPDGYDGSAVDGLTINVDNGATVTGTLSTGQNSAVNNEGDVTVAGTAVSVNGGSTVSNASTASGGITGDILFGAAGVAQTNALNNYNAGVGIVGDISSAGGQFNVDNTGDITGDVTSTGNTVISNSATGTITGNISSGGTTSVTNANVITGNISSTGNMTVSNTDTITGNITSDAGTDSVTNAAAATITGNISTGAAADTLSNSGTITGNADLGDDANAADNSGTITGNLATGTGNDAVANSGTVGGSVTLGDGNNAADNSGTITGSLTAGTGNDAVTNSGSVGGSVTLGDGDTAVANTGTITGSLTAGTGDDAVANSGSVGGSVTLGDGDTAVANTGTITGSLTAGTGFDAVDNSGAVGGSVTLGAGGSTVDNSGTVTGDLTSGSGNDALTNSGTIGGNVDLGDGTNTIGNSGTITGNITVGDGNDTITNTGTVGGNIAMGAGTNLITFGDSSQFPGGGTLSAAAAGDSTVIINGSGADTLGLTITGFDRLRKQGTGTWTLTDANVFDEAIYVDAGTLDTADADVLGGNDVVNNAAVTITGAGTGAYSGNMSGTGTLAISNTGTTTLSGVNTFTGGTTITAGTTALTGGSALADTGAVTVTAPGTLQVDTAEAIGSLAGSGAATLNATLSTGGANTSTTYSGVASGAGGLTKTGTGNFTLTGSNTFTGALTVSGGTLTLDEEGGNAIADTVAATVGAGATLALSTGETIGSLAGAGNVTLGANTLTNGGNGTSTTFSGVISGTGAVVKDGAGTLTLTGTNTYSGGTTLSAGGITGTTSGIQGDYTSAADTVLTFDQASSGTYAGDAALLGALVKSGAGTVTTTGDISAAEDTEVDGGRLNVNGTLTSDVLVDGATLGGTGTIVGDVAIVNGATLAPGNSIGTFSIDGDLAFGTIPEEEITTEAAEDATLQIEVASVSGALTSDLLAVSGAVSLDGTLAIVPATGFYRDGQTTTFLEAGSFVGDFADVTGLNPNQFVEFVIDVEEPLVTDAVSIGDEDSIGDPETTTFATLTVDRTAYATVADTANQAAVAGGLDAAVGAGITAGSDMETALTALDYTANAAAAQAAFDQMSGEIYGSFVSAGQWIGDAFQAQLDRRVRDNRLTGAGDGTGFQGWLRVYNYWNSMDTKNDLEGFDVDTYGFAAGFDSQVSDGFLVGLAFGYSKSDLDGDLLSRDGDIKSYQIGGYATGSVAGSGFIDASVFYGNNNGDMTRTISFGTLSRSTSADVDSSEFRARVAAGVNVGSETLRFRPYGAIEYSNLKVDGFSESGASALDLTVSDIDGDRFIGEVGLELDGSAGGNITPSAYAAYRHAFDRDDRVFTATFAGSAASTHTLVGQDGKDGVFAFGVAVGGEVAKGVYFSIDYDGEFNGDQKSHAIGGGIRAKF